MIESPVVGCRCQCGDARKRMVVSFMREMYFVRFCNWRHFYRSGCFCQYVQIKNHRMSDGCYDMIDVSAT